MCVRMNQYNNSLKLWFFCRIQYPRTPNAFALWWLLKSGFSELFSRLIQNFRPNINKQRHWRQSQERAVTTLETCNLYARNKDIAITKMMQTTSNIVWIHLVIGMFLMSKLAFLCPCPWKQYNQCKKQGLVARCQTQSWEMSKDSELNSITMEDRYFFIFFS